MNHGPVDKVIVAGGDVDTMDQAIRMLKPAEPSEMSTIWARAIM